jgi:hypothetical protein
MVATSALSAPLAAQESLSSDLWRVAAGTVTAPAPFAGGVAALLWNPVVSLPRDVRVTAGILSIQAPEEVGVSGGVVSASMRTGGNVVSLAWGRLGIDGITRTETSPEGVGGTIVVDAQLLAAGVTRSLTTGLRAGLVLRLAAEQLGDRGRTRGGLDAGVVAEPSPRLRFGAALRALDPFAGGGPDASLQLGAEASTAAVPALRTHMVLRARYGAAVQRGEAPAHLFMAGVALLEALAVDLGAVRESRSGAAVWRSRIGVTAGTPRYRLEFGRDGGVNGFGATYALGLAAVIR